MIRSPMIERERISRELCSSFGYIYQDGEWLGGIHEDEPVYPPLRDALIEARCRVEELEMAILTFSDCTCIECLKELLALREKEPKL